MNKLMKKNWGVVSFALIFLIAACQSSERKTSQSPPNERVVKVTLNDGAEMSPAQQERFIRIYRASEHLPDDLPIRLEIEKYQANPAIPLWADAREALLVRYKISEQEIPYVPDALTYNPPMYPFKMRQAGKDGSCEFIFTVSSSGVPEDIYLLQATEMTFAEHAEYALRQWRFPTSESARLFRIHFNFSGGSAVNWGKD